MGGTISPSTRQNLRGKLGCGCCSTRYFCQNLSCFTVTVSEIKWTISQRYLELKMSKPRKLWCLMRTIRGIPLYCRPLPELLVMQPRFRINQKLIFSIFCLFLVSVIATLQVDAIASTYCAALIFWNLQKIYLNISRIWTINDAHCCSVRGFSGLLRKLEAGYFF